MEAEIVGLAEAIGDELALVSKDTRTWTK